MGWRSALPVNVRLPLVLSDSQLVTATGGLCTPSVCPLAPEPGGQGLFSKLLDSNHLTLFLGDYIKGCTVCASSKGQH